MTLSSKISKKTHKKDSSSLSKGLQLFFGSGYLTTLKDALVPGQIYRIGSNRVVDGAFGEICEIHTINIVTDKTAFTYLNSYFVTKFKQYFEDVNFAEKEDMLVGVTFRYVGEKSSIGTKRSYQSIQFVGDGGEDFSVPDT